MGEIKLPINCNKWFSKIDQSLENKEKKKHIKIMFWGKLFYIP